MNSIILKLVYQNSDTENKEKYNDYMDHLSKKKMNNRNETAEK